MTLPYPNLSAKMQICDKELLDGTTELHCAYNLLLMSMGVQDNIPAAVLIAPHSHLIYDYEIHL